MLCKELSPRSFKKCVSCSALTKITSISCSYSECNTKAIAPYWIFLQNFLKNYLFHKGNHQCSWCAKAGNLPYQARLQIMPVTSMMGFILVFSLSEQSSFSTFLLIYFLLHIFRYINTWKHFTGVPKLPENWLTFLTLGVCALYWKVLPSIYFL